MQKQTALRLSEVNLLVVTDVHSFLAAHLHADGMCGVERCDASFGALLSFVQHLRAAGDKQGKDVFFFDNGDVVDGTGLSSATPVHGKAVLPLLTSLPLDALNCGNHELYQSRTVLEGLLGTVGPRPSFVGSWNGTYLTSNIVLASSGAPLGSRFALLKGRHGTRLLVLGWLYEMRDHCAAVNVTTIAAAVSEPWFAAAMAHAAHVDAIVVLAHMHYADPLVGEMLAAIRRAVGPAVLVQVLAGHSHIRASARLDARAAVLEAGHYADTVGFASFNASRGVSLHHSFVHEYVHMSRASLAAAAGVAAAAFDTPAGLALSRRIDETRDALGVSTALGCAPRTYRASAPLGADDSLWSLYLDVVAPAALFTPARNASQCFLTSTGALRYDLYAGRVTRDDVAMVLPFEDRLWVVQARGDVISKALASLNSGSAGGEDGEEGERPLRAEQAALPRYAATPSALAPEQLFDAIVGDFDRDAVAGAIRTAGGAAVGPPVRYDKAAVAARSIAPPLTDTDAWLRWARTLPQPPCGPPAPV